MNIPVPAQIDLMHLARELKPSGLVSTVCDKRWRMLRLDRESWTIRNEGVTCPACLKKMKET